MTEPRTEIVSAQESADSWVEWIKAVVLPTEPIQSPEEFEAWGTYLVQLKAAFKACEESRTEITKPLNAVIRKVNDRYAPAKKRFEQAERTLRAALSEYQTRIRKENEERMLAEFNARKAGDFEAAMANAPQPVAEAPGVSFRTVWEFGLSSGSANAIGMVPDQYKIQSLNEKAIRAYLAALRPGQSPCIPGVTFRKVEKPVVRS